MEAKSIREREILIRKPAQHRRGAVLLICANGHNPQGTHCFSHGKKLQRASAVISAQKPAMALRNDEWRRNQRWRSSEDATKKRVIRV